MSLRILTAVISITRRAASHVGVSVLVAGTLIALLPSPAPAQSLSDVFERVNSAVVTVRTTEREPGPGGQRNTVSVAGQGSGVLISNDGKVLTAAHIVDVASEIEVEFPEGERVRARVVASEPDADVALLQLERAPAGAAAARLGDSDRARIGDRVFIVGAPYGISRTLTMGHVSGRHRPGKVWDRFALAEFLQTDAAINRGNSGGPMFSMDGEVLGVVSHLPCALVGIQWCPSRRRPREEPQPAGARPARPASRREFACREARPARGLHQGYDW